MKLLTPEERKGLIYGSLVSAGIAALTGRNTGDAVMRAANSAGNAYVGGLNQIYDMRKAELEQERQEELIRASQEASKLARERFGHDQERFGFEKQKYGEERPLRELLEQEKLESMLQKNRQRDLIEQYIREDEAREIPDPNQMEKPRFEPRQRDAMRLAGPEHISTILKSILDPRPTQYYQFLNPQGNLDVLPKGQRPPEGSQPTIAAKPMEIDRGNKVTVVGPKGEKDYSKEPTPNAKLAAETKENTDDKAAVMKTYVNVTTGQSFNVDLRNKEDVKKVREQGLVELETAMKNPAFKYRWMKMQKAGTQSVESGPKKMTYDPKTGRLQ